MKQILTNEDRKAVVELRLEKAQTALEQAEGNIPMCYWEVIANRLYYAAYYAVSGLLVANGDVAQTHDGVIKMFGLHFVRTGLVTQEMGKHYSRLFSSRLTGDYSDTFDLQKEDVLPLVEPTKELIEVVTILAKERIQNL